MAKGSAAVPCVSGRESVNLTELEGVAKDSADVPCVLGRESANVNELEGVGNGSADVPRVLGGESANLVGLEEVANGSADVPCVLERESANLIGLDGVAKGSGDVPCVIGRESANLIELEGTAKIIRNELNNLYNEMERVDHLGTDRVGVGGAEQESGKILVEPATDVARLAGLFNHRIDITNTALDWTMDGLREAQQRDTEIAPLMEWKKTMQDSLMFGMTTRSYVQQWDDLHLIEGVLYRFWRSKDGLHQ